MSALVLKTDTDRRSRFSVSIIVAATLARFSFCPVTAGSFNANATIGVSLPFGVSDG